jgi:hypothetical protein
VHEKSGLEAHLHCTVRVPVVFVVCGRWTKGSRQLRKGQCRSIAWGYVCCLGFEIDRHLAVLCVQLLPIDKNILITITRQW